MNRDRVRLFIAAILSVLTVVAASQGQARRKVIIDQDAAGPAGTDQQAILLLIQSPQTEVLGITVVTGDAWLTEEVAHTLRTLELIGRTDIPVVRGAENPLVRTQRRDGVVGAALRLDRVAGCLDAQVSTMRRASLGRCRKACQPRSPLTKMPRTFWCAWSTSIRTKSRSTKADR